MVFLRSMPPLVWFLGGLVGGWCLRGLLGSGRWAAGSLRNETEAILDGVSRMHRSGALSSMRDLRLKHGGQRDNVQLLVRSWGDQDDLSGLEDFTSY